MNFPKIPFAGTLLFAYLLYSGFVPVSTSHSIIILSLALFAGFEQFQKHQQLPSTQKKLDDFHTELKTKLEEFDAKLLELKNEQTRQSIERANSSSASSKKTPIKF